MKRLGFILLILIPAVAQAFTMQWPVDCTLGQSCFVQNFVDHDVSPAAHDFACNANTYDGHNGTDIRLRSLAAMRAGVTVKSVADGVVLGTRNNVADVSIREASAPNNNGRECGNGVNIQHADGYRTQYCHMMNGSISVRTGQQVKAGEVLGKIGLSGQTEFPHLHVSVWKDNVSLDPFTGSAIADACNPALAQGHGLWTSPVAYSPTALVNDGMVDAPPDKERMRDIPVSLATMPVDAPMLLYWVDVMNVRAGDDLTMRITAPDGSIFAQKTTRIEKPMALRFTFIGKKNSAGKWPVGSYQAQMSLLRDGAVAAAGKREVVVR